MEKIKRVLVHMLGNGNVTRRAAVMGIPQNGNNEEESGGEEVSWGFRCM